MRVRIEFFNWGFAYKGYGIDQPTAAIVLEGLNIDYGVRGWNTQGATIVAEYGRTDWIPVPTSGNASRILLSLENRSVRVKSEDAIRIRGETQVEVIVYVGRTPQNLVGPTLVRAVGLFPAFNIMGTAVRSHSVVQELVDTRASVGI